MFQRRSSLLGGGPFHRCWNGLLVFALTLGTTVTQAQVVKIDADDLAGIDPDDPFDALITFDFTPPGTPGISAGPTGPIYTVSTDLGDIDVATGALFEGQTFDTVFESGVLGSQHQLVDTTPSSPLTLSTDLGVFVGGDGASFTSPVLKGTGFSTPISLKFSSPVAFFAFKAGFFDDLGSAILAAYDGDGKLLAFTPTSTEGFEYFGLASVSGESVIHGATLYHPVSFPGIDQFGVDNVILGGSTLLADAAELAVSTDSSTPVIAPTSTALAFPTGRVGDTTFGTVTLENTGGLGPLAVTFADVSTGDTSDFSGTGLTHLLGAGETSTDTYRFHPTTPGAKTATAGVTSDAGDVTIALSGTAGAPVFGLDGTAVDAGPATFTEATTEGPAQELPQIDYGKGEFSSTRTFLVDNASLSADLAGVTSLNIASVSIDDPAGRFSLADADEVAALLATTLEPSSDALPLTVLFDGLPLVDVSPEETVVLGDAFLEFVTDVNGPVDSELTTFRFALTASVVRTPEPGNIILWLIVVVVASPFLLRARRAAQKHPTA